MIIPLAAQYDQVGGWQARKIALPRRRLDIVTECAQRIGDQCVVLRNMESVVAGYKEDRRHKNWGGGQ